MPAVGLRADAPTLASLSTAPSAASARTVPSVRVIIEELPEPILEWPADAYAETFAEGPAAPAAKPVHAGKRRSASKQSARKSSASKPSTSKRPAARRAPVKAPELTLPGEGRP
jgi:hypothetical protein